jgi:predicted amidohydrolase YtcJ
MRQHNHWQGNKMKMLRNLALGLSILGLASCGEAPEREVTADAAWIGGTVLTMNADNDTASAVAIKDGRIIVVGTDSEVMATVGDDTALTDLNGKTMLPGFIDAHGHFPMAGDSALTQVAIQSPPVGTIKSIPELLEALRAKAAETPKGEWVFGMGYDDTLLAEKRHPTKEELDSVSVDHPVFAMHVSLHMGVANSALLEQAGITAATPAPEGGVIVLDDAGETTGLLLESAMWMILALSPQPTEEQKLQGVAMASELYASQGVTTAQMGLAAPDVVDRINKAAKKGYLPIRTIVWPGMQQAAGLNDGSYKPVSADPDFVHIGAVKVIADGSIQGYTGYLSEPYYVQPEESHGDDHGDHAGEEGAYRGFPAMPAEALKELLVSLHMAGFQLAVHGNGDAAIDDILDGFAAMQAARPDADARSIIIHAQMARDDQLDRMKALSATPSFFSLHTYYWGDRHRDIFMGPERAFRMNPAKSATDKGVPFTIHADTPVVPMEPLRLAWSATNRLSSSGQRIGEAQRITGLQALRATTINAAWQSFLEGDRGSLEAGKRADLVILADNPLDRPETMDTITVLETIVGGNTVYLNDNAEQNNE